MYNTATEVKGDNPRMFKEFKEFAIKGSVLDLAIGIIIGAAFGKIVTSFVNDVLMPPIGLILGKVDFTNMFLALNGATYESLAKAKAAGAPTLNYGVFINTVIDFLIVASVIFLLVKQINRMKRAEVAAAPSTKECPFCASNIALKAVRCPQCTSQV